VSEVDLAWKVNVIRVTDRLEHLENLISKIRASKLLLSSDEAVMTSCLPRIIAKDLVMRCKRQCRSSKCI
jgi:hypothetical protein